MAHYNSLSKQDVRSLLQIAKREYSNEKTPGTRVHRVHPTIAIQKRLQDAMRRPDRETREHLAHVYVDYVQGDTCHDVTDEIYSILTSGDEPPQASSNPWCSQCGGYYLPHEH